MSNRITNSNCKDLHSIRLETNRIYEYSEVRGSPTKDFCINLGQAGTRNLSSSDIAAEATQGSPEFSAGLARR
jgi:hypothetical protein